MYLAGDVRDRRFAGFEKITKQDALGITNTYYHQGDTASTTAGEATDSFALLGKPYREDVLSASSNTLKKTFYRWNAAELGSSSTTTTNTYSLDLEASSTPLQYASIADGSQTGLDFSDGMTLSMWVNFESDPNNNNTAYIGKRVGSGNQRSYLWYQNSASVMGFEWMSTGSDGTGAYVTWNPATSTWYHLAVTKSGTTVKFYVNGAQQGTDQTGAFSGVFNSTAPFEVGAWSNGGTPAQYIDGKIDDVRVWSRALSAK